MKKFGVAERLDIMVFPFQAAFRVEEFDYHMKNRTYQFFAASRAIAEKFFVAATQVDPETRRPPMTLSVITPRWHAASEETIEADVREYLANCKGLVVGTTFEEDGYVYVEIEMKKRRFRLYRAKIVKDDDGVRQLCRFEPTSLRASLPLLPAEPSDLA